MFYRSRYVLRRAFSPGLQQLHDALDVVDAAPPGSAADLLQRRPKACVVRQGTMWRQVPSRFSLRQDSCAFLGAETPFSFADEVNASFETRAINDDANEVAFAHFADRPVRQRFRSDMPNA